MNEILVGIYAFSAGWFCALYLAKKRIDVIVDRFEQAFYPYGNGK